MNWDLFKILALAGAYVLGSIPTSVWFGKIFYNIDLRDHGSGNAGATNALRVFGNKAGALVLFIDALKGATAVGIGYFFMGSFTRENYQVIFMLSLGASALLGHVFPIFAQFRGGKGIATLAGIGIAMFPWAVLICLGIFILVFIPTRYVSLGSMTAALSFPFILIFVLKSNLISEVIFGFGVAVFVLLTHQKNIRRLLKGQENKLHFKKKGIANS
jgi:acyl phosphate:glycerol-3-phosphate acyltransferase